MSRPYRDPKLAPFMKRAEGLFEAVSERLATLGGANEISIPAAHEIIARFLRDEFDRGWAEGRTDMRAKHVDELEKRGRFALESFVAAMKSGDGFAR